METHGADPAHCKQESVCQGNDNSEAFPKSFPGGPWWGGQWIGFKWVLGFQMHSLKHHCLDLGARLNKKEKANQIQMLIFLFFLTVDAVWSSTMSQASASMQSCCLDVPTMLTLLWGCEPRQNLPSFSCFCHDNKTSY